MSNLKKRIIIDFFETLNKYYKYAILHHVEKIFSSNDDIDLIVDASVKDMKEFIKNFVRKYNNLYILQIYTIDINIIRIDLVYIENDKFFKIELDCACNPKGLDLLKLKSNMLEYRTQININGFFVWKINDDLELDYYLKKKVYKKDNIEDYLIYLNKLNKNKIDLLQLKNKYKKHYSTLFFKLYKFFNRIYIFINRIFEKPSITISLLGSDGTGKTTLISLIKENNPFINFYYFHLKPFKTDMKSKKIIDNPHAYPEYGKIKSYIKLFYFLYQYNLGWIKNILPLKIKSSLIIFDRYYDDLLVDTKRYRYGGSIKFAKFIRNFIPKPDLYFVLVAEPEIIYERKKEVPFDEIKKQVKKYEELIDNKRYIKVDVSKTPDEIVSFIVKKILEKMSERYK